MANSGSAFDSKSIWDLASKGGLPFLKQYAKYKVPEFSAKGIAAPAFDPFGLTPSGSQETPSGKPNLEPTADVSKYGVWSPEDVLRFQQAYGDIASKQAAEQWTKVYYPGIMQAKQEDLRLQLAGDIYSPTKAATRNYLAAQGSALASQGLAATMGGEANRENALANLLRSAKEPARIGYAGQTFTA